MNKENEITLSNGDNFIAGAFLKKELLEKHSINIRKEITDALNIEFKKELERLEEDDG